MPHSLSCSILVLSGFPKMKDLKNIARAKWLTTKLLAIMPPSMHSVKIPHLKSFLFDSLRGFQL